MDEFISEDDLKTFEGWLRYQGLDAATMTAEQLATSRTFYDDTRLRSAANPKVGLMKLQPVPDEHRYGVAVREGDDLWLVLWVRRSRKGEYFVMKPMGDRDWDAHTSYHLDGTLHMKSHGRKVLRPQKRQPLTDAFRGSEHLGVNYGYAPKSVGAVCDPTAFNGIVEVPPNVLGPRHGGIAVDLLEPGQEPVEFITWPRMITRGVFRDSTPGVVITVGLQST